MSVFGALFTSERNAEGFDICLEDIHFQMNNSLSELSTTCREYDKIFGALDRLLILCDTIDNNDGMMESAVLKWVNYNNDLADALGISFATEEDASDDTKKENGQKVTEQKPGIFRRMWEAIKAFIKKILDGIGNFFHWLGSFFSANDKKIDDISKNADKIHENAKSPATEAFSQTTNAAGSMTAEIIMADPSKTQIMLESYAETIKALTDIYDKLITCVKTIESGYQDCGSVNHLDAALKHFTHVLESQKANRMNLVEFEISKANGIDQYMHKAHEFQITSLTAPKRIVFKSPNVKRILNAYAELGWIEKPILTQGFKTMEKRFKDLKFTIDDLLEYMKTLHHSSIKHLKIQNQSLLSM